MGRTKLFWIGAIAQTIHVVILATFGIIYLIPWQDIFEDVSSISIPPLDPFALAFLSYLAFNVITIMFMIRGKNKEQEQ